jgi:hypothetical protein
LSVAPTANSLALYLWDILLPLLTDQLSPVTAKWGGVHRTIYLIPVFQGVLTQLIILNMALVSTPSVRGEIDRTFGVAYVKCKGYNGLSTTYDVAKQLADSALAGGARAAQRGFTYMSGGTAISVGGPTIVAVVTVAAGTVIAVQKIQSDEKRSENEVAARAAAAQAANNHEMEVLILKEKARAAEALAERMVHKQERAGIFTRVTIEKKPAVGLDEFNRSEFDKFLKDHPQFVVVDKRVIELYTDAVARGDLAAARRHYSDMFRELSGISQHVANIVTQG